MATRTVYVTSKTGTRYGPYTYSKGGGGGGAGSGKKGGKKSAPKKVTGADIKKQRAKVEELKGKRQYLEKTENIRPGTAMHRKVVKPLKAKEDKENAKLTAMKAKGPIGSDPKDPIYKSIKDVKPRRSERQRIDKESKARAEKAKASGTTNISAGAKDLLARGYTKAEVKAVLPDTVFHHDKYSNTSKAEVSFVKEKKACGY
tara:strand:- start:271 stop:876 length:606 start_codon:yes stop_codon:yes gene_type:complete